VNGVLEFGGIDEEAVRLAVYILAEGGVGVAGEAILVFELVVGGLD
jgi:hypothetical protein